jgi:phosphoglycolate phosphatase
MRLLLFDLDGTLLSTGGIGRSCTRKALEMVFGTSGNLDDFYPGGRTQEAIFLDTLLDAGLDFNDFLNKRDQLYQYFLSEFKSELSTNQYPVWALPGALELMENLSGSGEFLPGLVTGNHTEIAAIKLRAAGLDPEFFPIGSYGEESRHRPDLVRLAKQRAEDQSGVKFPGFSTVVVGDTTRDVLSAQASDALSIALTTGTDDRQMLEAVNPDQILDGLNELRAVLGF